MVRQNDLYEPRPLRVRHLDFIFDDSYEVVIKLRVT